MTLRFKKLSAELVWICLGQLMVVTGGIFGVRLLTYRLSASLYGDLDISMTTVMIVQQIIFTPLGQSFLRFFAPAYGEGRLNLFIKAVKLLLTKGTAIIIIIAVISTIGLFVFGYTKWLWLFPLAFIYSLFSGYNIILDYIQNAARQRKIVALHQGIEQWLHFFIPVGLIVLWGHYSSIVMFGFIIASVIILVSQLRFFQSKIAASVVMTNETVPVEILNKYTKQIFDYAWPFSIWGLFAWAQLASSRWALLSFASIKDVGLYAVLYQFGYYPIVVVSGLASQFATPVLFGRVGSGNDADRVADTIRLNNLLILVAVIATVIFVALAWIFHQKIFSLVVAPEYRLVSSLLPWLVLSGGLLAIGQMINIVFLVKTNTQILIYPKIVTAIIGVMLNYLGAYFYGLIGVVIAGIAFPLIYLIWIAAMYVFSEKQYKNLLFNR